MSDRTCPFDYLTPLQDFLARREWKDPVQFDEERGTHYVLTTISLADVQGGELLILANPSNQTLTVEIELAGFRVPKNRRTECAVLCNDVNDRFRFGRVVVRENGSVHYSHSVDCEGVQPGGEMINQLVGSAWQTLDETAALFAAVALTQQSAADLWSAHLAKV